MVAISSSFVLLAILASVAAAPFIRDADHDVFIDADLLSGDSSKASLLDVDVGSHEQHRPALSSRLFGKRAQHYTPDDSDYSLLDVALLGDDHTYPHSHSASTYEHSHDGSLLDIDLRRRAEPTTGDVIDPSGTEDPVSEAQAVRARAFKGRKKATRADASPSPSSTATASGDKKRDGLLDVDILSGHHHSYVAAPAQASAIPESVAAPSSASAPAPSADASSSKSSSSSSASDGLVFAPGSIKQSARRPAAKGSIKATSSAHKTKATSSTHNTKPKPQIKLAATGKPQVKLASPTQGADATSVDATSVSPATSAVYTHDDDDDASLLDLDILKRAPPAYAPESFDRRPVVAQSC